MFQNVNKHFPLECNRSQIEHFSAAMVAAKWNGGKKNTQRQKESS